MPRERVWEALTLMNALDKSLGCNADVCVVGQYSSKPLTMTGEFLSKIWFLSNCLR